MTIPRWLCILTTAMVAGGPIEEVVFLSCGEGDDVDISRDEALDLLKRSLFDYVDRPRVFFSSLYPVDIDKFRKDADALCEALLDNCRYRRKTWAPNGTKPEKLRVEKPANSNTGILKR